MGCGSCACCLETLYSVETRQDTDVLVARLASAAFLERNETRTSLVTRVMGHSAIRISLQTNGDVRVRVEANNEPDGSGPFREVARFDTVADAAGNGNFIETQVLPSARFIRIIEQELAGAVITAYRLVVEAQPIGSNPGAWAGLGSQIGPGDNIFTKADIVVGAAVETNLILAADIPPGTRRISLKNVGANPIRIKEDGGAGGAGRGQELAAGQTMSIGTRGGAIQVIDGFSTAGTTMGFFFERD